jgi:hypothetical protein
MKHALILLLLATTAAANTISFKDGRTTRYQPGGTAVGDYYDGVRMPNLRFHTTNYDGNVAFGFTDQWGAVVDWGELKTATGFIEFDHEVRAVTLKAASVGEGMWTVKAFDSNGGCLTQATDVFTGWRSILNLKADQPIRKLEIVANCKFGVDEINYSARVPDSGTTLLLMGLSLAGLVLWRSFR